jgi:hypothetical protein
MESHELFPAKNMHGKELSYSSEDFKMLLFCITSSEIPTYSCMWISQASLGATNHITAENVKLFFMLIILNYTMYDLSR